MALATPTESGPRSRPRNRAMKRKAPRHVNGPSRPRLATPRCPPAPLRSRSPPSRPPFSPMCTPGASGLAAGGSHGYRRVVQPRFPCRVVGADGQADAPVTGYNVYVGTRSGAQYEAPANGALPVAGRSYLVTHLVAGTTYFFTVRAVNAVGVQPPPPGGVGPVGRLPCGRTAGGTGGGDGVEPTAPATGWPTPPVPCRQGYVADYGSTAGVS